MSAGWEAHSATAQKSGTKKQGRRRNIPSTTLPAPDIEIGSRHPVNFRMPGIPAGMCEPVHKGGKKVAERRAVTVENIPLPGHMVQWPDRTASQGYLQ
jgi:hypothetical protein